MSGNADVREIFRYAKPSQHEMDNVAENIFKDDKDGKEDTDVKEHPEEFLGERQHHE